MLTPGDRIELVACSDGQGGQWLEASETLRATLTSLGFLVTQGLPIDRAYGESLRPPTAHPAPDADRAEHLMTVLEDPEIAAVFDVSGGSLATGVLTHLDPARLARTNGYFMGFSNLTTIANAIYAAGGGSSILLNPRLIGTSSAVRELFVDACISRAGSRGEPAQPGHPFVTPAVEFVRGGSMTGPVVGGNLTGFLSLAGTPWFPRLDGAILAIEALSPTYPAVLVGLHQLRQMGAFDRVSGVLLGQFTAIEDEHGPDVVPQLALEIIPAVPIARTSHFGHSADSQALMIGSDLTIT